MSTGKQPPRPSRSPIHGGICSSPDPDDAGRRGPAMGSLPCRCPAGGGSPCCSGLGLWDALDTDLASGRELGGRGLSCVSPAPASPLVAVGSTAFEGGGLGAAFFNPDRFFVATDFFRVDCFSGDASGNSVADSTTKPSVSASARACCSFSALKTRLRGRPVSRPFPLISKRGISDLFSRFSDYGSVRWAFPSPASFPADCLDV